MEVYRIHDTVGFFSWVQQHEFDELRFDIRAHDCTYFLRATTVEEKEAWVEAIEGNSVCVAFLFYYIWHLQVLEVGCYNL